MAKKNLTIFVCSNCGYSQTGYLGRCPECGCWNTLVEKKLTTQTDKNSNTFLQKSTPKPLSSIIVKEDSRVLTGFSEFDRVLGGGAMRRSVILLGGEPGIGKSTLLLQTASFISEKGSVLYVSGEESDGQIKNRCDRLQLNTKNISLLCTTNLEDILESLETLHSDFIIIDSIQTVYSNQAGVVPGTISQLKYCANELISYAKGSGAILFLTAHITKEGIIAGPKSLEHMVDTVISFEQNGDEVRFLHSQKNRFGSVEELGIFSMTNKGLMCVSNPSLMFITRRENKLPSGIARTAIFSGSRVFLVEVQALTVPAKSSLTRVYSDKIDNARVSRVAAVLEKRLGIKFCDQDIYINVAGGIKINESACDLALAASLYSSRIDLPLAKDCILIGEVSLAGEVRPVAKLKQRIKTAVSLGFSMILVPEKEEEKEAKKVQNLKDMIQILFS